MALAAAKQVFPMIANEYLQSGVTLKYIYNNSDNSPKDFRSTSFLGQICEILIENNVKGCWDFGCPEECKWLCDLYGGLDKTAIANHLHKIQWGLDGKSYAETAKEFLTKHFQQERFQHKDKHQHILVKRKYFVINPDDVLRNKIKYKTFVGMKQYYHFEFEQSGKIKAKSFACECDSCFDLKIDDCDRTHISGKCVEHDLVEEQKQSESESTHRKVTQMNELKSLMVDFFKLQDTSNQYIMTEEAYSELKLQTKASLDKALIFVYCMERKYNDTHDDKYTFADETCKQSRHAYVRKVLKYEKVKLLYEDTLNKVSTNYVPNVEKLQICVVVHSNRNVNVSTNDRIDTNNFDVNMNDRYDNHRNNMEICINTPTNLLAAIPALLPPENDSTMNPRQLYNMDINVNPLNVHYANTHSTNQHKNMIM
eukprot:164523_1